MTKVKVFITDDHMLMVDGLTKIIEAWEGYEICGVAYSGNSCLKSEALSEANLMLLDLNMPDGDGISIIPPLKKNYPDLRILLVTHYKEQKILSNAYKLGIDGHVWKTACSKELYKASQEVMEGMVYMPKGFSIFPKKKDVNLNIALSLKDSYSDLKKLTPREIQILHLISEAKPIKQIANELFISQETVTVHKKNIMKKLEVRNLAGIIKFAFEQNVKDLVD